jgi:hypothetical protein
MKRTGRVGQLCACTGAYPASSATAANSTASADFINDPFKSDMALSPLAFCQFTGTLSILSCKDNDPGGMRLRGLSRSGDCATMPSHPIA